jgi:hypothetical protein
MRVGGQRRTFSLREGDPVPTVQEDGWAPGSVWAGAENLAPTGIRSPGRPARSESLYRLSYRGPTVHFVNYIEQIHNILHTDFIANCIICNIL